MRLSAGESTAAGVGGILSVSSPGTTSFWSSIAAEDVVYRLILFLQRGER